MEEQTVMSMLRRLSDGIYQGFAPEHLARYEGEVCDALRPVAEQMEMAIRDGEPGRLVYLVGATAKVLELMVGEIVRASEKVKAMEN